MAELDTNIPLAASQQNPYGRINFSPLGDGLSDLADSYTQRQMNQAKLSDFYDKQNFRAILVKHQNDDPSLKDQNIINEAQQNGLDSYAKSYRDTYVIPNAIKNAAANAYAPTIGTTTVANPAYDAAVNAYPGQYKGTDIDPTALSTDTGIAARPDTVFNNAQTKYLDSIKGLNVNPEMPTMGVSDENIGNNGAAPKADTTSANSSDNQTIGPTGLEASDAYANANQDFYQKYLSQYGLNIGKTPETSTIATSTPPTPLEAQQKYAQALAGIATTVPEANDVGRNALMGANTKLGISQYDLQYAQRMQAVQQQYLSSHPELGYKNIGDIPPDVNQQLIADDSVLRTMRPELATQLGKNSNTSAGFANKLTQEDVKNAASFGKDVEPIRRVSQLYQEMMSPLKDVKNKDGTTSPSPVVGKILNAQKTFFALAKDQGENIDDILSSHLGAVGMLAKGAQLTGLIQRYNSSSNPKDQQDANILEHIYRIRQGANGGFDPQLDDPDVSNFYANYQKFVNRVLHTDDGKRITNPEINLQASSMGLNEFSNPGQMLASLLNYGNDLKGQLDAAKKTTTPDIVSAFSNLPGMDVNKPNISSSGWLNKDGSFKYLPTSGTAIGVGNPGGSNNKVDTFHSDHVPGGKNMKVKNNGGTSSDPAGLFN